MRILAVDDDPIFLDILKLLLIDEGYDDITLASDAAHALKLISEARTPYECFLLDMVMPNMDGITLCRHIRNMPPYRLTPILMVTVLADETSIDRAFSAGANDFITKPVNGLEIAGRVRSASILIQQMNKKTALEKSVHQLEAAIINLSKTRREIEVVSAPNCMSIAHLEDMLSTLPNGMYAISCFAVRISETASLLARLPPEDFETMLANVANHLSTDLAPLHHNFAYYGNGIFGGVVFGRKALLMTKKGVKSFGISETVVVPSKAGEAELLTLRLLEAPTVPLLSGRQAAAALRDAITELEKTPADPLHRQIDGDYLQLRQRSKAWANAMPLEAENFAHNIFLE